MTDHERAAREAMRLRSDPLLVAALAALQREAMGALVTVRADDITEILRLQAKAQFVDEFLSELEAVIIRGTPQATPAVS